MKIYYIEPFYGQSHKEWIDSYQKYSKHEVRIFSLSGRFWKWRMQGGAISLAEKVSTEEVPDFFLVSGMIDLALFKSLLDAKFRDVPISLYFHENQFAYPEGVRAKKNQLHHYSFMNFKSCLVADKAYFNSVYNRDSFLAGAKKLLKKMPDQVNPSWFENVKSKCQVLPLGIEGRVSNRDENQGAPFLVLWNHRWEHDKNPEEFFKLLFELKKEGHIFELAVIGEGFKVNPEIFDEAKEVLSDEIKHWGFQEKEDYFKILSKADILPVTSNHEFFGVSVLEACLNGAYPLLPKRLAYPENYPKEFLYSSYEELKIKMKKVLNERLKTDDHFLAGLKRFEWENMVQVYDQEFSNS
jgi:glycosyltransferase involved in cell wall biosynthesis